MHLGCELRELHFKLPLERRDLRVRLLHSHLEIVLIAPQQRVRCAECVDNVSELRQLGGRGVTLRAPRDDVRFALVEASIQKSHRRVEAVHVRALLRRQRAQRRVLRREPRDLSVERDALLLVSRLDDRNRRLRAALLR